MLNEAFVKMETGGESACFCVLKYVVKALALAMGSVKRIAWRKEGERRDGREKGREN